jgi:hypothetical protein
MGFFQEQLALLGVRGNGTEFTMLPLASPDAIGSIALSSSYKFLCGTRVLCTGI